MRTILFIFMFLLLVACEQKGQKLKSEGDSQPALQSHGDKVPLAQVEFPEGKLFDFGFYYEKVNVEHDFPIHNPGKVPLVISKIETFCSCTRATGPEKPILEGQTDTIHVIYDGNGFVEGNWSKTIRIFANINDSFADLLIMGGYFVKIE